MTLIRPVRTFAAWLITFLVMTGCTVPPTPVLRPGAQPLGRTWTYRVSDRQGTLLGQIVSQIISVDGSRLTQETRETFNGVTISRLSSAIFQPDGSLLVEDSDGRVSPLPSVRQRLSPGATWDNPDGTTVTVELQESVTVPAGTYVAYRLRQRKGETTIVDWFYPAIGLIKEQSDQAVVELVNFGTEPIAGPTLPPGS